MRCSRFLRSFVCLFLSLAFLTLTSVNVYASDSTSVNVIIDEDMLFDSPLMSYFASNYPSYGNGTVPCNIYTFKTDGTTVTIGDSMFTPEVVGTLPSDRTLSASFYYYFDEATSGISFEAGESYNLTFYYNLECAFTTNENLNWSDIVKTKSNKIVSYNRTSYGWEDFSIIHPQCDVTYNESTSILKVAYKNVLFDNNANLLDLQFRLYFPTSTTDQFNGYILMEPISVTSLKVGDAKVLSNISNGISNVFNGIKELPAKIADGVEGFFQELGDKVDGVKNKVGEVVENVKELPQNIANSVEGFFDEVGEKVEGLGNKLLDGIVNLFVPSEESIEEYSDKWDLLLADRFGAVYQSVDIVHSFVEDVQHYSEQGTIVMPTVSTNLAGADFSFGGYEVKIVPDGFEFLADAVALIVDIVCTMAFITAMKKRYEGVISK